jgi:hypothetical protein
MLRGPRTCVSRQAFSIWQPADDSEVREPGTSRQAASPRASRGFRQNALRARRCLRACRADRRLLRRRVHAAPRSPRLRTICIRRARVWLRPSHPHTRSVSLGVVRLPVAQSRMASKHLPTNARESALCQVGTDEAIAGLFPVAIPSMDARLLEGVCGQMVMGVRLFLIAIVLLAVAALTFLLATA